jgi:hypothetical protein
MKLKLPSNLCNVLSPLLLIKEMIREGEDKFLTEIYKREDKMED